MIEAFLAFGFGLLIGSFLNVCIYRWPRDLSIVRPRSHCTACQTPIAWYDNVPLASFVVLGGRCRHCRENISLRYPAVELLTGLLFFYFAYTLGPDVAAIKMCVFAAMLVTLFFSDLEQRILPDEFTLGGAGVGLVFAFFVPVPDDMAQVVLWLISRTDITGRSRSLAEAALGAALPALFLWAGGWLYYQLRHREGLGFGDVKLIAMVGAFLGLRGALYTLILGSIAGSVLGFGYIKLAHKDPATYELPFGTFLAAAALATAMGARQVLGG